MVASSLPVTRGRNLNLSLIRWPTVAYHSYLVDWLSSLLFCFDKYFGRGSMLGYLCWLYLPPHGWEHSILSL